MEILVIYIYNIPQQINYLAHETERAHSFVILSTLKAETISKLSFYLPGVRYATPIVKKSIFVSNRMDRHIIH